MNPKSERPSMLFSKAPENFDGENSHEILTLFGMAFFQAQVLEVAVTNLAVVLEALSRPEVSSETLQDSFSRFEKETLGTILRAVRKYVSVDQETEAVLVRLLGVRNYLAHSFFKEHDTNYASPEGRAVMASELHAYIQAFYDCHYRVEEIYEPLWAKLGITRENVEEILLARELASNCTVPR